MKVRWIWIFFALVQAPGAALAQNQGLRAILYNDKEQVAHTYSERDLRRARARDGDFSESAFRVTLETFDGIEKNQTDSEVFAKWVNALKTAGFEDPATQIPRFLVLWRAQNWIDDVLFKIAANQGKGLIRYLRTLQTVKNRAKASSASSLSSDPNPFSSSFLNRRHRLTYREDLYARFSSTQILLLSDVLKHLFTRLEATRARLVFMYPDREDSIDLSPMGQYFFARRLLLKEMQELNRSFLFQGVEFGYEEVITAALETGLVNGEMLSEVFKIDDLWNPAVAPWEKVSGLAIRVSGSATVFLPPPFNVVGSLAILVLEGLIENRHRGVTQARDGYDPF